MSYPSLNGTEFRRQAFLESTASPWVADGKSAAEEVSLQMSVFRVDKVADNLGVPFAFASSPVERAVLEIDTGDCITASGAPTTKMIQLAPFSASLGSLRSLRTLWLVGSVLHLISELINLHLQIR
ncbi:hypothetical protein T10_3927 [Trichinella papuae]|uniref:Uncharacterized protein n=1 Tax=Trichinella papuae TaxID=268474 RepID=A0A0V1N3E2_9BILA|nr:hypothetical protein T10_3927 [Trichinella papuae]